MRRNGPIMVPLWLVLVCFPIQAQEQDTPPVVVDKTERAEVRLVLLDTVVIDSNGDPVPGLTKEDFEIRHGGEIVTPDILETRCDEGWQEPQVAAGDEPPRKLVMAFDYLHLAMPEREWALDTAMKMVEEGGVAGDEVMLVALTGGLRIEQPFTSDSGAVLASLKRMQKDITLWNGNFNHINETGFVRSVTSLFDVLATASTGPKAVVLYSAMLDVPLDYEFERIAAIAATSRCAIYTVDPYGLYAPGMDSPGGPG